MVTAAIPLRSTTRLLSGARGARSVPCRRVETPSEPPIRRRWYPPVVRSHPSLTPPNAPPSSDSEFFRFQQRVLCKGCVWRSRALDVGLLIQIIAGVLFKLSRANMEHIAPESTMFRVHRSRERCQFTLNIAARAVGD